MEESFLKNYALSCKLYNISDTSPVAWCKNIVVEIWKLSQKWGEDIARVINYRLYNLKGAIGDVVSDAVINMSSEIGRIQELRKSFFTGSKDFSLQEFMFL